jgi:hypothetical protein
LVDEGELLATLGRGDALPTPTSEPTPEYASLLEFLGRAIQGVR